MPNYLQDEFPKHPFWDFSLTVYADSRVKEACLYFQYRYRLNVNIILFCCWAAQAGYPALTEKDMLHAKQAIEKWHTEVTLKIRTIRQQLAKSRLLPTTSTIELTAECVEQLLLAEILEHQTTTSRPTQKQLQLAKINLINYLKITDNATITHEEQRLEDILSAIFMIEPTPAL